MVEEEHSKTSRQVPDTEEIPLSTLIEKYHQGAIWYGNHEMNIGWPQKLHISGQNLIRLLSRLRDDLSEELYAVKDALDHHKVPNPDGLSQADRIHLLVGRNR